MTTKSITFTPEQQKQYERFVEDASNRALKEVNPDKNGLQNLIEKGGEFQTYLVDGIRRFTAKEPDYELARTILDGDFISPEEIVKANRVVFYTSDQLAEFGKTLPSKEVLEWCRDNDCILIAGPAKVMSLLEIRELKSEYFYSKSGGWYANDSEKFSRNDKAETRWIMLRKKPIANSTSKTWDEQQSLLSKLENVPNAAEVVWGLTVYKAIRGIYLLPDVYVRTSSLGSDGHHVHVGNFGADGLSVSSSWDDDRDGNIGLSASRKQ